jgi:hypothetical protein
MIILDPVRLSQLGYGTNVQEKQCKEPLQMSMRTALYTRNAASNTNTARQ